MNLITQMHAHNVAIYTMNKYLYNLPLFNNYIWLYDKAVIEKLNWDSG